MVAPSIAPPGERLRRVDRLRRRNEFVRCYRHGRRWRGSLLALHALPNEAGRPRFGVTASRKVGGSVVRHRLRRRAREIFRRWQGRSRLPNVDIVAHFYPRAATADFATLERELFDLLLAVSRHRPEERRGR